MLMCPRCGRNSSLWVECTIIARINEDNDLVDGYDINIKDGSPILCSECGYEDYIDNFKIKEEDNVKMS